MAEIDPYAVLGVPRTATREEILRSYRRLAKQHHPDAGAAPNPLMARINEARAILADPLRRARWDRAHTVVEPPAWTAPTLRPRQSTRPPPITAPPPTVYDSGWLAVVVVAVAGSLLAVVLLAIAMASSPERVDVPSFSSEDLTLNLAPDWIAYPGSDTDPAHRVIAHFVTFEVGLDQRCTNFAGDCPLTADALPPGEASVVITAWGEGAPKIPDPVYARPFGRDADRFIGGEPAAFELSRSTEGAVAWWQLSPPGFPDRWIEVRADIGGGVFEQDNRIREVDEVLATLEFGEG